MMKYQFISRGSRVKWLICPYCHEENSYYDIEIYARCPFCDGIFEKNDQLEDFVLEPLVAQWEMQCTIQASLGIQN